MAGGGGRTHAYHSGSCGFDTSALQKPNQNKTKQLGACGSRL
jgi:hypothetical protein